MVGRDELCAEVKCGGKQQGRRVTGRDVEKGEREVRATPRNSVQEQEESKATKPTDG